MNLGDVAKKINGTLEGDSSIEITGVSSIETAKKGHITFSKGKKFIDKLQKSWNSLLYKLMFKNYI